MHSRVSLAANGSSFSKSECEERNRPLVSRDRNKPKAWAANWGIVIISDSLRCYDVTRYDGQIRLFAYYTSNSRHCFTERDLFILGRITPLNCGGRYRQRWAGQVRLPCERLLLALTGMGQQ